MTLLNSHKYFQQFKNNWIDVKHKKTIFYGASKDFVQLIETLDIILDENLKIDLVIDDFVSGDFNSLYEVNSTSYKPDGYITENKRKISITNSLEFFNKCKNLKNYKFVISTDSKKNLYQDKLISLGLTKNIDFCDYKVYAALLPYYINNKVHIWRADIMLTEKCTLNCTFCNMYMPHFKEAKHRSLESIKSDLDLFFKTIDYVSIFHLVGGEPFMYPYVYEAIEHVGKNYRNKIGRLLITTNGTLTPKENTMQLLKKYKVLVSISDYTDEIRYNRRLENTVNLLKENKIEHFVRKDISWNDFGHPEIEKFKETEEVKKHFQKCTAPYKGLNNGKYFYCHLNTSANLAGIIPDNSNDYIYLDKLENREDILKHDLGFLPLGYATFCKNCNGCNTGIEIPVGPGKQGVRNKLSYT